MLKVIFQFLCLSVLCCGFMISCLGCRPADAASPTNAVNLTSFDATACNGQYSDLASINSAIMQLTTTDGAAGGTVVLPTGTCIIDGSGLVISGQNITLAGQGVAGSASQSATTISCATGLSDCITFEGSSGGGLRDLWVDRSYLALQSIITVGQSPIPATSLRVTTGYLKQQPVSLQSGSKTITFTSGVVPPSVREGQLVSGDNIASNSIITSVNPAGGSSPFLVDGTTTPAALQYKFANCTGTPTATVQFDGINVD